MTTEELKNSATKLIDEIDTYLDQAEELDKKKSSLEDFERQLRELETEIQDKDSVSVKKEKELAEREAYLNSLESKLKGWQTKLSSQEVNVKLQLEKIPALELLRSETQKKIQELDDKKKEYEGLQKKSEELETAERLLAREKAIDRERKKKLEIQEDEIKIVKKRLGMEDEVRQEVNPL